VAQGLLGGLDGAAVVAVVAARGLLEGLDHLVADAAPDPLEDEV
jgi:hypothetical protein